MKKIVALLIFVLFWAGAARAQNEGTLTFMNSLPQVVNNNPAFIPKYKLAIGLPISSAAFFYSNNGFAYKDLYSKVEDTVKADLPKLNRALRPKNYITQAMQLDLLQFGLKVNPRLYVTFNMTAKVYNRLMVPKNVMALFTEGNSAFVGQTVNLAVKGESVTYLETAIGGAYKVDEKLTVGARLKLLKGITNITTRNASASLSVDKTNYALSGVAAMDVRSSGIQNFDQKGFDFGSHIKDYFTNNGYAIDIGATYKLDDRITLGASLIDIGKIRWKNNTYGYSLDPSTANYTFAGFDLSKILAGDKSYTDALNTDISQKFTPKDTAISSYSTPIPGKMYLSGMYEVKKNFSAGAVFFAEKFRNRFAAGLTLGVNKHFGRVFSASGSYTITSNSYNNLGAGMSLNLSPVQIYFVGDNLLRMPLSAGDMSRFVNSTKFFTLRLGLNFVFGWDTKKGKKTGVKKGPDDDRGMRRKMYKNYTH